MERDVTGSALALTVLAMLHYRPLHPYGMQRLIKQWGKDHVVNVGQRAGLYRTMERLESAGLITARATERDPGYPERTVYEVTDAGRQAAATWLRNMLTTPKAEFPEFPAALSNLLLLTRRQMVRALQQRVDALQAALDELDAGLAAETDRGLPRITLLETEYTRTMTHAELQWVRLVLDDLRSGEISWSRRALARIGESIDASATR